MNEKTNETVKEATGLNDDDLQLLIAYMAVLSGSAKVGRERAVVFIKEMSETKALQKFSIEGLLILQLAQELRGVVDTLNGIIANET